MPFRWSGAVAVCHAILLCRLFPFGQLLCLFDRFRHCEKAFACVPPTHQAHTSREFFGSPEIPVQKIPRFTGRIAMLSFSIPFSRQKFTRCLRMCSPCFAGDCVTIFASQPMAYLHAYRKNLHCATCHFVLPCRANLRHSQRNRSCFPYSLFGERLL